MDIEQLRKDLEASRRFDVEYHGATLHLRMPPEHEFKRIYRLRSTFEEREVVVEKDGKKETATERVVTEFNLDGAERDVVLAAVVGWDGVTDAHIRGEEATGEQVPFDAELARQWFDYDQNALDAVSEAVFSRRIKRTKALEADEKN